MKNLKTQIKIIMLSGILALLSGGFAHLALTDIFHMETDVTLEWNIVRFAAILIVLFIISALVTLRQTLRILQD